MMCLYPSLILVYLRIGGWGVFNDFLLSRAILLSFIQLLDLEYVANGILNHL